MTAYNIYIRCAAERDIVAAQKWYESQQPGLASDFNAEFNAALDRLAHSPLIYEVVYRDVRRAILHPFPFLIWYRVQGSDITVLACTHGKINPGTLLERLR